MAKKLRDEDLLLNIIVNGDQGRKEMLKLQRNTRDLKNEVKSLESQQKKLRTEGKKNTQEYKNITAAIRQKSQAIEMAEARITELRKGMDLTRMSAVDLRKEMNRLRQLRDLATPQTKTWKALDGQLKKVSARYSQINNDQGAVARSLQKMTGTFRKYFGVFAAGAASMAGVVFGIRKVAEEFASLDDKLADVQKTSGLSAETVDEVNEALKGLDTRTAQEGLIGLATVGGKLGNATKEDLLGFVGAVDQINVALSEDLGGNIEETVRTVGKLVDIFGIRDQFGLQAGLLKVGSLINTLGQSSTANEGAIVDFVNRVSGLNKSFGVTISDSAGLASAVDQLNLSVEVAGTTYNQVIPNMMKDTKTFAKIAQMEYGEFVRLLEEDVNGAFIKVLEGVRGSDESNIMLIKRMGELGLQGARVTNVITALANNTDLLKQEQLLAASAFEEGTSITAEFNLKNTTAAAKLEKSRKALTEVRVELGKRLFPVLTSGNSLMIIGLNILKSLITFLSKYGFILISLTVGILAYNGAIAVSNIVLGEAIFLTKLKVFWDKALRASTLLAAAAQAIFTGNLTRASLAMKIFNRVTKLNPLVLFLSLLVAVGTALILYNRRLTDAERAQRALNNAEIDAQKAIIDEKLILDEKLRVARDEKRSLEERKKAIEDLQALSPEYLKGISLEKINTNEAKIATDKYVDSLLKKARVEAAQNKLKELAERELDLKTSGKGAKSSFGQKLGFAALNAISPGRARNYAAKTGAQNFSSAQAAIDTERKAILQYIDQNKVPLTILSIDPDPDPGGATPMTEDEIKAYFNKVKAQLEKGMANITESLRAQYLNQELTKKEFDARMKEYNFAFMVAEKAAREQAGMDTLEIDQRINDAQFELMESAMVRNLANKKAMNERIMDELKQMTDREIAELDRKAAAEEAADQIKLDRLLEIQKAKEVEAKAAVVAGYNSGAAAIENAETFKEATAMVLDSIRLRVLARIDEAVIDAMGGVLKNVPFPLNFAIATIAGAAVRGLLGKLVPKQSSRSRETVAEGREDGGFWNVTRAQDGRKYQARDRGSSRGFFSRPSLLVSENNKPEFVANNMAVQNPTVKPVLDAIDSAQRNGSISSINLMRVLNGADGISVPGRQNGGFTNGGSESGSGPDIGPLLENVNRSISALNEKLSKPLGVSPWSMKDRIDELNDAQGSKL